MSTMSLSQDARLSAGLTGEVVLPGQPRFDDARQAFNLAADQPAAVVFAGSARDVAAAITFAADHGPRIAAQGTGHTASNGTVVGHNRSSNVANPSFRYTPPGLIKDHHLQARPGVAGAPRGGQAGDVC